MVGGCGALTVSMDYGGFTRFFYVFYTVCIKPNMFDVSNGRLKSEEMELGLFGDLFLVPVRQFEDDKVQTAEVKTHGQTLTGHTFARM